MFWSKKVRGHIPSKYTFFLSLSFSKLQKLTSAKNPQTITARRDLEDPCQTPRVSLKIFMMNPNISPKSFMVTSPTLDFASCFSFINNPLTECVSQTHKTKEFLKFLMHTNVREPPFLLITELTPFVVFNFPPSISNFP